ncbi:hypothetical protein B0J12DRAFT_698158 [Macrophomina phaseolina]|uniref:GA4 desaturase n=1 Tax=Macrophomina phaseolina TaxID=35725 RepID=A0ABQ8GGF6_9PEZI|nr:hypothetical protein B0J12DRAFT_698158 [Macrophomina phaseolina]
MAATVLPPQVPIAPHTASTSERQSARLGPTDFETYVYYLKVASETDLASNQIQIMMGEETEDPRTVVVRDIRPHIDEFTLDKDGAEVLQISEQYDLLAEDDDTYFAEVDRYLKDVRDLLKKKTGARFVKTFLTISRPRCLHHKHPDPKVPTPYRKFTIPRAHADFSPDSVPAVWQNLPRMHMQMCEKGDQFMEEWNEANELLKENPRVMLLGAWKPLVTVKSVPFCWVDPRTVDDENDYVHMPRVEKSVYNGGISIMKHEAPGPSKHGWFYVHEQQPHELLLFKHYDSKDGVVCKVAHAGLEKPGTEHLPDRLNIETRVAVIF